mgnify:CR=1 FL=1
MSNTTAIKKVMFGNVNTYVTDNRMLHTPKFTGCFTVYDETHGVHNVFITQVLYNAPATIVWWSDGTQTKCKVRGEDKYSRESGLMHCIMKKIAGTTNFDELLSEWLPAQLTLEVKNEYVSLSDVRKAHKRKI